MRRARLDRLTGAAVFTRQRSLKILVSIALLYLLLVTLELPFVFKTGSNSVSPDNTLTRPDPIHSRKEERDAPTRPIERVSSNHQQPSQSRRPDPIVVSGLVFDPSSFDSELYKSAKIAWEVGRKFWSELQAGNVKVEPKRVGALKNGSEKPCPHSITVTGSDLSDPGRVVVVPCGLTVGSYVTIVGRPRKAHEEPEPKIALVGEGESVMVSQFKMELLGLKTTEGEDPPRLLHFNPRLKGDWSGTPVIELNTCYRMQWGSAQRCEGWKSKAGEETVDGQVKCEKWIRDDDDRSEESKATWWLSRLVRRTKKVTVDWPYPFGEEKLFVLTLSAGLEGYHVNVDGRHITSFPYHNGFSLEDATGLSLSGDVDLHSVYAASLPTSHPSFAPQKHLEMSPIWCAPPLSGGEIELFIGILSAGNHFAERMAVRKSWMQHSLIKSSEVVARFFVALHSKKEVNVELKKEAEFFGDIVIVPYMDNYDLVVLKTVAICEYGVHTMSAKYIMKCDDDTFVRVDAVIIEASRVPKGRSLYVGNINYYHKPLRYGKWAVTYEEWPEEDYPPYANGPGYILSSDIAKFIISEFESRKLRLFKMEDVSMGMWVEKFNSSQPVEYMHSLNFCQFGCVEGYFTAHYQSPRQMICLWDKLKKLGRPQCCSGR